MDKRIIRQWKQEEIEWLIKNSNKLSVEELVKHLGFDRRELVRKAKLIGLDLFNRWKDWEIEILKSNIDKTDSEIQRLFLPNRTKGQIRSAFERYKISKIRGRVWTEEDVELFKQVYSDSSFEDLKRIFPNITTGECQWMREKYKLSKSSARMHAVKMENTKKTKVYWTDEKHEYIKELLKSHEDVFIAVDIFRQKYPENNSQFIVKKIIDNKMVKESILFSMQRLSLKYKGLNLADAFKFYKKIVNINIIGCPNFTKEQTVFLFRYWLKTKNICKTKDSVLSITKWRDLFIESNLLCSIKKHYRYSYEFILDCFWKYEIYPWELSIQVPKGFFNNLHNVRWMICKGIGNLKTDNIIKKDLDVLCLKRSFINEYFNLLSLRVYGIKEVFIDYFEYNGIHIDKTKLKIFDNTRFDSLEELSLYKFLKNNNIKVKKCTKKDKFHNSLHDENYIPDFFIYINDEVIVVEYFGLYLKKENISPIIQVYKAKTHRKIEFFKRSVKHFISFFSEDLENNYSGIKNKLKELGLFEG